MQLRLCKSRTPEHFVEQKWREGYLVPTWAWKITCRHFDWMLQGETLASYFPSSSWYQIVFSSFMQKPTEKPQKIVEPSSTVKSISFNFPQVLLGFQKFGSPLFQSQPPQQQHTHLGSCLQVWPTSHLLLTMNSTVVSFWECGVTIIKFNILPLRMTSDSFSLGVP